MYMYFTEVYIHIGYREIFVCMYMYCTEVYMHKLAASDSEVRCHRAIKHQVDALRQLKEIFVLVCHSLSLSLSLSLSVCVYVLIYIHILAVTK